MKINAVRTLFVCFHHNKSVKTIAVAPSKAERTPPLGNEAGRAAFPDVVAAPAAPVLDADDEEAEPEVLLTKPELALDPAAEVAEAVEFEAALEGPAAPDAVADPETPDAVPDSSLPVPHGMAGSPALGLGWSAFSGGTVLPWASAMAKRVVH